MPPRLAGPGLSASTELWLKLHCNCDGCQDDAIRRRSSSCGALVRNMSAHAETILHDLVSFRSALVRTRRLSRSPCTTRCLYCCPPCLLPQLPTCPCCPKCPSSHFAPPSPPSQCFKHTHACTLFVPRANARSMSLHCHEDLQCSINTILAFIDFLVIINSVRSLQARFWRSCLIMSYIRTPNPNLIH